MFRSSAALVFFLLTSCSHTGSAVKGPENKQVAVKTEITPEQMQEAMAKASHIGENHRKLDPLVGTYKTEAKFWMKPGQAPQLATGTAEFKWILGGHYLMQEYKSSFQGEPFNGEGVIGYSNLNNRYESTWIDSMGTEIMKSQGGANTDGSVITFNGQFECPLTKGPMKTREILTMTKDRHVFEMFHPALDGSGEFKAMEIVYERVKPTAKHSAAKKLNRKG